MSAERLIASHLRLAGDALDGARLLLEGANRNAVYLAEQAVEQIVLALAQAEGVHFPRSAQHQLDTMMRSLPEANGFRKRLLPLAWLEAYATTFRYPRTKGGVTEPPATEKLEETSAAIAELLDALIRYFDVRVEAGGAVAGRIGDRTPPHRFESAHVRVEQIEKHHRGPL